MQHQEKYGAREGRRKVAILVTDGQPNMEVESLAEEAELAHQAGIQMYAIGLGTDIQLDSLNTVASDPDVAHTYHVTTASDGVDNSIMLKWSDCITPRESKNIHTMNNYTSLYASFCENFKLMF